MDCSLCYEPNPLLLCPHCSKATCVPCSKKVLLDSIDDQCVHCRVKWTQTFIEKNLGTKFWCGELRKHKEEVNFDRVRSSFPVVLQEITFKKEEKRIDSEIKELTRRIKELRHEKRNLEITTDENNKTISKCPTDDCRGFISSTWKCTICSVEICSSCSLTKEEEHQCEEENIESFSKIKKDSKKCPGCQAFIHRIEGCNQMFCTSCHVSFNWTTLKITRNGHNPHYIEWLQRGGNNVGSDSCNPNQLPDPQSWFTLFSEISRTPIFNKLMRLEEYIQDTDEQVTHNLRLFEEKKKKLVSKLLLGTLSEENLKKKVWSMEEKYTLQRDIFSVWDTFSLIYKNLAHELLSSSAISHELEEATQEEDTNNLETLINRMIDLEKEMNEKVVVLLGSKKKLFNTFTKFEIYVLSGERTRKRTFRNRNGVLMMREGGGRYRVVGRRMRSRARR
jgi:hypothetical protein